MKMTILNMMDGFTNYYNNSSDIIFGIQYTNSLLGSTK